MFSLPKAVTAVKNLSLDCPAASTGMALLANSNFQIGEGSLPGRGVPGRCWSELLRLVHAKDRAVIFDMDGILIDSEKINQKLWQVSAALALTVLDPASCREKRLLSLGPARSPDAIGVFVDSNPLLIAELKDSFNSTVLLPSEERLRLRRQRLGSFCDGFLACLTKEFKGLGTAVALESLGDQIVSGRLFPHKLFELTLGCARLRSKALLSPYLGSLAYDLGREIRLEFSRRYHSSLGFAEKAGASALLGKLRQQGFRLAVATSTERPVARKLLSDSGLLEYFDALVCGSEVKRSKPAPDIFLHAAQVLGSRPESCIGVEDSPSGLKALEAAKFLVVHIPDIVALNWQQKPQRSYITLPDLKELQRLLGRAVKQ